MVTTRRQERAKKSSETGTERTCVGCRTRHAGEDLLRCVALPAPGDKGEEAMTIAIDWSGRAPGRGVYVSPSTSCVQRALHKGGFQRSLRSRLVLPEAEAFLHEMRDGLRRLMGQRLSLARRAGSVVSGEARVMSCLKQDKGLLLVLSSDLSEGSRRKHTTNAQRKGLPVIEVMTGEDMGACIGRPHAGVILVDAQPFASDLQRLARQLAGLQEEPGAGRTRGGSQS